MVLGEGGRIYYTYKGMKFSTQTWLNVIRQLKQNNMNSSETKLLKVQIVNTDKDS